MKSWFSAVCVLETTAFLYRGIMIYTPNTGCPVLGVHITEKCDASRLLYMNRSCALTQWNDSIIPRHDVRSNYAMLPAFNCFLASSIEACTAAGAGPPGIERPSTQALRLMAS